MNHPSPSINQITIPPEREEIVIASYQSAGFTLADVKRQDHGDTMLIFSPGNDSDPVKLQKCLDLLNRLFETDRKVTIYYLKLDCLIGLFGVLCFILSAFALRSGGQILFTLLLILGVFCCTITLYLRPLFTNMGMKKYGQNDPAILQELLEMIHTGKEEMQI